jgi:hypothetical protein
LFDCLFIILLNLDIAAGAEKYSAAARKAGLPEIMGIVYTAIEGPLGACAPAGGIACAAGVEGSRACGGNNRI